MSLDATHASGYLEGEENICFLVIPLVVWWFWQTFTAYFDNKEMNINYFGYGGAQGYLLVMKQNREEIIMVCCLIRLICWDVVGNGVKSQNSSSFKFRIINACYLNFNRKSIPRVWWEGQ